MPAPQQPLSPPAVPSVAAPEPAAPAVVPRRAARVLVLDGAGRVLMLHGFDPAVPAVRYWFTVGGGLDDGETSVSAASRELYEETGLVVPPERFGAPVHHDVAEFGFAGVRYRQEQDFYLLRVA